MDDNVLGKRLKWIREKKRIKQSEVAHDLNITTYQVSRYENGKTKPEPSMIVKFAVYYEVKTDFLLGVTDDPYLSDNDLDDRAREILRLLDDMPASMRDSFEELMLTHARALINPDDD